MYFAKYVRLDNVETEPLPLKVSLTFNVSHTMDQGENREEVEDERENSYTIN